MRTRLLGIVLAAAPLAALAIDAPHNGSYTSGDCQACHKLHNFATDPPSAIGDGLINQPTNATLCDSCHVSTATTQNRFDMPFATGDLAQPGVGGIHHRWDALASSPQFGAQMPQNAEMLRRLPGGRLECSTCHDQHAASKAFAPGGLHVSIATATATVPTGGSGGAPTLTLLAVPATAAPKAYRVRILRVVGTTQVELGLCNDDFRSTPTAGECLAWLNWNGTAWVAGTVTGLGTPASLVTAGATFNLNDGANVQIQIGGTLTASAGRFWDFYVSFPHLRMSNISDAMCKDCHRSRVMTFADVGGTNPSLPANGTTLYSHPVGQGLNAGGSHTYDFTTPRDADGSPQVASGADADGNASNNLVLDSSGFVQCTTCHGVHNADSNSLTPDAR